MRSEVLVKYRFRAIEASERRSPPVDRSVEAFHCRAVYGPPSARASKTGEAPWRAQERDSTGCRSGATVEREVSEGSESPERSVRTKPGIYGEARERQDASAYKSQEQWTISQ